MLKTYTITQNGSSNGNVIAQPFTIELHKICYVDKDGVSRMEVHSCTKNGSSEECANDDIASFKGYALPGMGSSKNADLSGFEADLEAAYPGNWS